MIAGAIFVAFLSLARLLASYSEKLLAPFITNVMLRSVAGSLMSTVVVIAGLLLALSVLNLTHLVLSILGVAGMVGLAVGFAFRDITENFIASILLGTPPAVPDRRLHPGRRASRRGHVAQHTRDRAGHARRETDPDPQQHHLQGNPDQLVGVAHLAGDVRRVDPLRGVDHCCDHRDHAGDRGPGRGLARPTARVLVETMETNGIRLRAYYWVAVEDVDGLKLLSDLRLKTKVALQQAGIAPPPIGVLVSIVGRVPVELLEANGQSQPATALRPRAVVTPEQANVNMQIDKRAAKTLTAVPTNGETSVVDHVMNSAETHVSEEGRNLLEESAPLKASQPAEA